MNLERVEIIYQEVFPNVEDKSNQITHRLKLGETKTMNGKDFKIVKITGE